MTADLRRTTAEAKGGVADMLPGYLVHARSGQREAHGGLSPRQVPKAWVQGLQDAGATSAKVAKVRRDGGWATLPLVVQMDCPFDHVDDSGETWAKVRLKVNPYTGWVSIHEDSCRRCAQSQIEEWLLTCPRCAAGESRQTHPDHDDPDACALFYAPGGDGSPIACVVEAMAQFQNGETLVADSKQRAPSSLTGVVTLLNSLTRPDGSLLIPPTLGQAAAWEAVKNLPDCPTQALVRQAQAERKRLAGGTE